MATSRIRPLRPVEFVALAELLLADLAADRGDDPAETMPEDERHAYMGTLTLERLNALCRPMPAGQAIGDLAAMGCVEKPKKSNEREIPNRLRITKLGEDALLRQAPGVVAQFKDEARGVKAEGADEIKARKAHWGEMIRRVEIAVADLQRATQPQPEPAA